MLSEAGTVELVGSTARGRSARGVRVGARAAAVPSSAGPADRGILVQRLGRRAFVYVLRRGRVHAVAVTTAGLARDGKALRDAVRWLRRAKATQVRPTYEPGKVESESGPGLRGRTLAGTSNPRVDAALAALCRLQVQA